MHPSLELLHAACAQALQGFSPQVLEVHPANDAARWNARQIVEHLILTCQSSSAVFRDRLAKGRPTQTRPNVWQQVQQLVVCRFGLIPIRRPAPPGVIPPAMGSEGLDGNLLCSKLRAELHAMDELLVLCEQQFGVRRFATHQILGPLSAAQWRRFHVAHGSHHLQQIRRLRSAASSLTKKSEIPAQN